VKVKGKEKPVKIYEVFPDDAAHASLKDALPAFNEALACFYARQWEKAALLLESALKARSDDQASLNLLERCREFLKQPPPDDWDGSHELESK
jgi:adenylate cyclase